MPELMTLQPQAPYHFPLLLDFLSRFAHPTLDVVREGAYWRVLRVGEHMALLKITSQGRADAPELVIEIAAQSGEIEPAALLNTLRQVVFIDSDRKPFYNFARQDEALWGVVYPLLGLPELRTVSVFDALMQTIIEQQIAWVTAQKAQRWLVEWAGNRIQHNGFDYYAFPTPEQIAAASVDDLKPLKITFKRMALMIDLAKQMANGSLQLEALRDLSPDEAYKQLLSIKGIGHWTATVTLERALGYDSWIAHNDVVLQAATNRYFYGGQGRIPPEQVIETFERYGEFAGLAARYTMYRWVLEQYPMRAAAS